MSLITLPSLPDPILHLICIYLTPDRPTVNETIHGQQPTLYRSIINLSLTAHCLNRISSTHIATNISLTAACTRYSLFLRSVTSNPIYASHVRYLKYSENTLNAGATTEDSDGLGTLLKALSGLEVLYAYGAHHAPARILKSLTTPNPLSLCKTLQAIRLDHVNAWQEHEVVQLTLVRGEPICEGTTGECHTTGTHLLTGDLHDLDVSALGEKITGVVGVEDDSDYEDDWEAEYGFSVPKVEAVKEGGGAAVVAVPPVLGVPARGASLLDF
ncbi:hypothetical protein PtrSN002B_006131 [Pyrenophora tritici-repentis]|nr:hypothetical protein PtrSN001A_005943 [Pyrenophora tritici-repentis]KAI1544819.1 hypothetical protein PtrSN001C_003405 [Pyrenophora tritici-repentis]KAI1549800.1 hypothetical protein PtrSN002B_006131 [Pyrenophora tritici-repentis]KAI1590006.1 hypothetical protein PtrEW13061_005844 [Pyrenophora tritici-repentis]KAI1604384.1 hypothetical protein PtrCC142_003445 [Pyrenophora tritici-repentis]